jgi:hypothetical protein
VEHDAAGGGGAHPLGDVEAGLGRLDALQRLRQHLGDADHQDHGQRGQQEDRRGQDGLEQVEGVALVAELDLHGREAGRPEQDQERGDGDPRGHLGHRRQVVGEQAAGHAVGGQGRGEQGHLHGDG